MNIGKYWKRRFLGALKDIWKGDRNMRKKAKRLTVMLLALAMVLAMVPAVSGPVYAADEVTLPQGEVQASTLEAGHVYRVPGAGTAIVLEAGDDVTVDKITSNQGGTLTIKGSDAGKLTVTNGIAMEGSAQSLVVEGGTLCVDRTDSGNWKFGIASGHYTQHGGNVIAKITNDTGVNAGLFANYGFYMDGGTLTASGESGDTISYGLICEGADGGRVVVEGGTINAFAKGDSAYSIKAQYMDVKGGEIVAKADSTGGATGFHPNVYAGSTFTMTGGKVNMTVNGTGGELMYYQTVTISGGSLNGTVTANRGQVYGIESYGERASFKMTDGALDITASNTGGGGIAYGLRLVNMDVTGGSIKVKAGGGYQSAGILCQYSENELISIEKTDLDITVDSAGDAYGILTSCPVSIVGGTTLISAKGQGEYHSSYGISTSKKLTMFRADADIEAIAQNYPSGIQVYAAEINESLAEISAVCTGKGAIGASIYENLALNGTTLTISANCQDEGASGIETQSSACDWNIRDSYVTVNAESNADGAYGNKAIYNIHEQGGSKVTVTDSTIIANCKAPGALAEGITLFPDLILQGDSEVRATGVGKDNAHGVYTRGKIKLIGSHAKVYGKGTISVEGYECGIWASRGVDEPYKVTIPEGGIIEDGIVTTAPGSPAAPEAQIEGLPSKHLRIYGSSRYETAYSAANYLKELKGDDKLPTVIIADGRNFADALSGSYLAKVTESPILLVHPIYEEEVFGYIQSNVEAAGKVYLLGGTGAISEDFEGKLNAAGYDVKRLGGSDRFATNILILKEANSIDSTVAKELLVCSGMGFADALSTSSVGKPILLVGNSLNEGQKDFLRDITATDAWIIGGTGAVNEDIENELKGFVPEDRIYRLNGSNRFETSLLVAEEFFPGSRTTAVLVYGLTFPDGLSGGAVASFIGAPVLLCTDQVATNGPAATWVRESGAYKSITFGGPKLIPLERVRAIMDQPDMEIVVYGA